MVIMEEDVSPFVPSHLLLARTQAANCGLGSRSITLKAIEQEDRRSVCVTELVK